MAKSPYHSHEEQLQAFLDVAEPSVVEKLCLPRLCMLLSAYRVKDEVGGNEAAQRMKALINSPLIEEAME